ncbi:hypothetical protein C8F04DRAFT_955224, partial [Mycena alexandri]
RLKIYFIIIGAGVTGLSCAIALRRNGHRVTVIEKNRNTTDPQHWRGIRMPPNLTKVLINWGLKDRLQSISVKLETNSRHDGELLSVQDWEEELLAETRGEYLFAHLSDLMVLLCDEATRLGVEIVFGTKVTNIQSTKTADDSGQWKWTINTDVGRTWCTDVIVGADGGSQGYCKVDNTLFCWLGRGRSVVGYPIVSPSLLASVSLLFSQGGLGTEEFALCAYGPDTQGDIVGKITEILDGTEPRLRNLLSPLLSSKSLQRHPVAIGKPLKNWVQRGGLVLIGTGAHPLPPGSVQEKAMDVEDGALLARLFSYLRSPDHIGTLLSVFGELRRGRCMAVMESEANILQYTCLPEGEHHAWDNALRAKKAAGLQALRAGGDHEETQEWWEVKEVFSYEVEDKADEWWLSWGAPRFRREVLDEVEVPATLSWGGQVKHEVVR